MEEITVHTFCIDGASKLCIGSDLDCNQCPFNTVDSFKEWFTSFMSNATNKEK